MLKKRFSLPVVAVLGGAVAFLLRLWQLHTAFEADTGLPISGAPAGPVLAVFLLLMAVLLIVTARQLPNEEGDGPALPADFPVQDSRLLLLPVAGLLLMAAAGLADLYEGFSGGNLLSQLQTAADPYGAAALSDVSGFSRQAQLLLGLLSLLSAASLFPAVSACRQRRDALSNSTLLLAPPVALVVRLVLTYRIDSVDPILSAYYPEVLALVLLTLAFYRLSSFAFQVGRTRRFALYTGASVVLALTTLAGGGAYLSSLLLYLGGAAVLLGFLLLRLLAPASSGPSEASEP